MQPLANPDLSATSMSAKTFVRNQREVKGGGGGVNMMPSNEQFLGQREKDPNLGMKK